MKLRRSNLGKLRRQAFDVLIVGGGINGAVSAAALAGRGAQVALIDKGDFAGLTSMNSSNLAWGGIKYMETWDFPLVRKLCMSRNLLMRSYPSTVQEIRFFTTLARGFRHRPPLLFLGAWLYWFIGNSFTRVPRYLSPGRIRDEEPLVDLRDAAGGVEYSDAYLHDNDARFVFNFVRTAMDHGCVAANYVESLGAHRDGKWWVARARETVGDRSEFEIRARVLVNAAGPLVDSHNALTGETTAHRHELSKGIHLIVRRLVEKRRVLAFFADDGRLFFVIPMGNRTCIGTTDTAVNDPDVGVTDADVAYVLDNINKRLLLTRPLVREDIIATRCGVRPLAVMTGHGKDRDFLHLSRKHAVEMRREDAHISIFGGKLTDCLNVGNEISDLVRSLGIELPHSNYKWYGEPPDSVREEFFHQARLLGLDGYTSQRSSEPLSTRLWRRYGAEALGLLENIREDPREAEVLIEGTEYLRCEVAQAARREMITKLEDFLRRRSKIALVERSEDIRRSPGLKDACRLLFGEQAEEKLDEYFATSAAAGPTLR